MDEEPVRTVVVNMTDTREGIITILHGLMPVKAALENEPELWEKIREVETTLLKMALQKQK